MKNNKFDEVIKTLLEAEKKSEKSKKNGEKTKKDEKVKKVKKPKTLKLCREDLPVLPENVLFDAINAGVSSRLKNSIYFDKAHREMRRKSNEALERIRASVNK